MWWRKKGQRWFPEFLPEPIPVWALLPEGPAQEPMGDVTRYLYNRWIDSKDPSQCELLMIGSDSLLRYLANMEREFEAYEKEKVK